MSPGAQPVNGNPQFGGRSALLFCEAQQAIAQVGEFSAGCA
jgi:hypothetical protein